MHGAELHIKVWEEENFEEADGRKRKKRGQRLGILACTIAEGKQKMESRTKMRDQANCCYYKYI